MATYAVQSPPHAGAAITLAAPGGLTGDLAPTGPGIGLLVVNGATPTSITLTALGVDGLPGAIRTWAIAATSVNILPLPASVYGAGTVGITYANVTTLTGTANTGVAVVTIPGN
jgi:hypothetical protein